MAPMGSGLAGYSGGTAQVFDLLPFYPPETGGTLTLRAESDSARVRLSMVGEARAQGRPSTSAAFVPPKPKELLSAVRNGRDSGRRMGG
jgi:hypothetical protein